MNYNDILDFSQLQHRDQARGEMHRADLGAVAEFEHRGDEVHDDHGEELIGVVMLGIGDVAVDEPEVERRRQKDEKAEDDLL